MWLHVVKGSAVWINFRTGTCACQDKGAVQHACRLPVPCGSKRTKLALVGWCGGSLQRTHTGRGVGADWYRVRGAHTQQYSNEPQHWQTSKESGRHACSIAARSVRTIGFLSTRRPPTSAFHFTPRTRQTTVAFTGKKKQLITRGNKAPVSGAAHASPHIFLCELGRTHAPTPFMGFYNHRPKQCQRSR